MPAPSYSDAAGGAVRIPARPRSTWRRRRRFGFLSGGQPQKCRGARRRQVPDRRMLVSLQPPCVDFLLRVHSTADIVGSAYRGQAVLVVECPTSQSSGRSSIASAMSAGASSRMRRPTRRNNDRESMLTPLLR